MSLAKQLETAAERLEVAGAQIAELRARTDLQGEAREWLEALSEMVAAASDIQSLNNESLHEKLHAIASQLGVDATL